MNLLKRTEVVKLVVSRALALLGCFIASSAMAQISGVSARQASSGSLRFLAYYQGVADQEVAFRVAGAGSCSTQTGGVSFPCGQSGDVDAEGSGGAGMIKMVWQPHERLQYYAHFGVGRYELRVPSTTVVNALRGDNPGVLYGAGLKASIVPDTVVNPAIGLDLSLTRSVYNFNRSSPGASPAGGNINQRLTLMTYRVDLETSHLFVLDENWKLEPYGGLRWTRVDADLKDLVDGGHAGGKKDAVSPFLGLRVPLGSHETLFAEGSFLGGKQYGAGLELRFK
jgi:hypothetical protein